MENEISHKFVPEHICPKIISFDLNVIFDGGCSGNLQALCKLVEGMTIEQIEQYLKGICCGTKSSSCPDQLSIAVREAYESSNQVSS